MSMFSSLVVPGEPISVEKGFLKGHGTYIDEKCSSHSSSSSTDGPILVASVAGRVERVNKLISAKQAKSRYMGNVGDLVVGRICAIENKRWKVDIKGVSQNMLLLLWTRLYLLKTKKSKSKEDLAVILNINDENINDNQLFSNGVFALGAYFIHDRY